MTRWAMITGHSRGHEIQFINNKWIWTNTKEPIKKEKPCKKCGEMPTKEGYDACLGYIPGAISACCGHGIGEKYIKYRNNNENRN